MSVGEFILTLISATGIVGLFTKFILSAVGKKLQKEKSDREALEKGVQALLRDRLISLYESSKHSDGVPIYVKQNFENMYEQYHALGANGVMDSIHEEFQNLPTSGS